MGRRPTLEENANQATSIADDSLLEFRSVLIVVGRPPLQQDQLWGYLWELRMLRLHPLPADVVRIGRLGDSHIVLTHPLGSRRHLEIRRTAEGVVVKDLGSTNGTRLNFLELRAGQEAPIRPGAFLEVAAEKLPGSASLQWTPNERRGIWVFKWRRKRNVGSSRRNSEQRQCG